MPQRHRASTYADGQGNTQKAISDIQGMVAKGVNAIVVFPDAGRPCCRPCAARTRPV